MKTSSKLILMLLLTGTAVLLGLGLRPQPVPVSLAEVERGALVESVEEEGRTVLRHPHLLLVPVDGILRRVEMEEGDPVREGQTLFVLDPPPSPVLDARALAQAREDVSAAEAEVRAAEAALAARVAERGFAEREVERNLPLRDREVISPSDLDRLTTLRDQALEVEKAAGHRVEVARRHLRRTLATLDEFQAFQEEEASPLNVRSPVDGVLLALHRRDAGPVAAGTPVMALGSLDALEVRVDLLSMDAVRVEEGTRVVMTRWGGEEELEGTVRRVDPAGFERVSALGVEEQRVPVWIRFTSPRETRARLGTEFRVEARFIIWEGVDELQIPASAVFRHKGGSAVFVVENERAAVRAVRTGRRDGARVQVLEGLEEGELVIPHPGDRVSEGVRVR